MIFGKIVFNMHNYLICTIMYNIIVQNYLSKKKVKKRIRVSQKIIMAQLLLKPNIDLNLLKK